MKSILSPFDNETVIGAVEIKNAEQANELMARAHSLFLDKDSWLPPYQRRQILYKLAELMREQVENLALLIAAEGGKPLIDARVEVARAIEGVVLAAEEIAHLNGEEIPMGLTAASVNRIAFTTREPIGVVVAVSAFNHPLNLAVHQVIPAVAAGCPVIIKPASRTPFSALQLQELLSKAGLPEGWCEVCICDNQTATQLVTDSRVGFFSFIGSAAVGWKLKSQLAPGVRCALEHGGAAPVILDETALAMPHLIKSLVKGGFYHAGQVCVSVQRIFAPANIAEQLATELANAAAQLVVGDPTDPATEVGPLIQVSEVDRVEAWVQEAMEKGAKLMGGGKRLSATTYAPTVLLNPPQDAHVSQYEIFGPVMCVYSYEDRFDAIAQANSLPLAFQAAVFTQNINVALDTAKRLDATAVIINDHTAFRVDWMPFGGRKHSGMGMGGIPYTMKEMTQEKMLVFNMNN